MSAEQFVDDVISLFSRMTAREILNDMLTEARLTDRAVCGNCTHWMKKGSCPRELGVMKGGPSAKSPSCSKFDLEDWVRKLKAERLQKAAAFAVKHQFEIPTICTVAP